MVIGHVYLKHWAALFMTLPNNIVWHYLPKPIGICIAQYDI